MVFLQLFSGTPCNSARDRDDGPLRVCRVPYQTTEITECTTPFCQMNPRVRMRRKEENKNLTRVSKFLIAQSQTPKEEGGEKSAFRRVVRVTSSSSSRQKKLLNQEFLAAHDDAQAQVFCSRPGVKKATFNVTLCSSGLPCVMSFPRFPGSI